MTIGIPVYKSKAHIKRALESALAQTYMSIEYLLIDDAGDDGSLVIMKEMQQMHSRGAAIRIISHDWNLGVSASRNQIIEESRGEYLYFMDSDDVIADNTISILMRNAQKYDAEIVFGSYEIINTSGERVVYQYPSLQFLEEDELPSFAYRKYAGIQASACNYLVKTSVLRENNLRFIQSDYWEDMVFTFDLVTYITRSVLLPDITYFYYYREGSLSNFQKRDCISKNEFLRNVQTINYLKRTTLSLIKKDYYPNRCYVIAMTDLYIACNILKRRKDIVPPFSNNEIKEIMSHPASFWQICSFGQSRLKNFILYMISKLPTFLFIAVVWVIGKTKKLI